MGCRKLGLRVLNAFGEDVLRSYGKTETEMLQR